MWMRALVAASIVLAGLLAEAQTRAPWHVAVPAPRPALPALTVDLGYPGSYVPWQNAPITLHAVAGDQPFDGYIGFHFRAKEHETYDIPVIARATLRPHEQWSFSTFFQLQRWYAMESALQPSPLRELAIEWRDRAQRRMAIRVAGVPPWTQWDSRPVPLRIAAPGEHPSTTVLGREAFITDAGALSDVAQWYAGFSEAVVRVDTWIDTPRRVKEAVFGSRIEVVFIGFPRAGQKLDDIDRLLLPVRFVEGTSSYRVPWLYASDGATVAAPLGWKAKPETERVGDPNQPYIVRNRAAVWIADERGAAMELPGTSLVNSPLGASRPRTRPASHHPTWPGAGTILRLSAVPLITLGAIAASVLGWMILRKRPRTAVAAALVLAAVASAVAATRIRPASGTLRNVHLAPVADGILLRSVFDLDYGQNPLPERRLGPMGRTSVTDAYSQLRAFELRGPETPMFFGAIAARWDWTSFSREFRRRESGPTPRVTIQRREGDSMTLEYESPFPIDRVSAQWQCGDFVCYGSSVVRKSARGVATLRHRHEPALLDSLEMEPAALSRTFVLLSATTGRGTVTVGWRGERLVDPGSVLTVKQRPTTPASAWTFALPLDQVPARSALRLGLSSRMPALPIEVTTMKSHVTLPIDAGHAPAGGVRSYTLPQTLVREIIDGGGIVKVAMQVPPGTNPSPWERTGWIEVSELKP